MKAVVQRVESASVSIGGKMVAQIGSGILLFLGVAEGDTQKEADYLSEKAVHLRIFEDEEGKMNRSLLDVAGDMLVVSQFTLLGDCRKGRRPSFVEAARPEEAIPLYEYFKNQVRGLGVATVQTGVFGADMKIGLVNDGPVTILLNTRQENGI